MLRQSVQAASGKLPAELSAFSAVEVTRVAMMGDQTLSKARGGVFLGWRGQAGRATAVRASFLFRRTLP